MDPSQQQQSNRGNNQHQEQSLENRLRSMIMQNPNAPAPPSQPTTPLHRNMAPLSSTTSQQQQQRRRHHNHNHNPRPMPNPPEPSAPNSVHRNSRQSQTLPLTDPAGVGTFNSLSVPRGPRQRQPRQFGPAEPQAQTAGRGRGTHPSNFTPIPRPLFSPQERTASQSAYLESLARQELPKLQMSNEEYTAKESFRRHLEHTLQEVVQHYYYPPVSNVKLICFGSVGSGFATPGSDMDLALVTPVALPDVLRNFEKVLLDHGTGARLLSRTRVPILKICESPTPELLSALREERDKWDKMTEDEREKYDRPAGRTDDNTTQASSSKNGSTPGTRIADPKGKHSDAAANTPNEPQNSINRDGNSGSHPTQDDASLQLTPDLVQTLQALTLDNGAAGAVKKERGQQGRKRPWYREKALGALDFPKDGVGIQCDINEANPLGIHNTVLLRCYASCDPRVTSIVLFVKSWAARRKINSARNGTLSSYGYVLMVLHFLVNVAKPPVCPNLQLMPHPSMPAEPERCNGFDVTFWRDEAEIRKHATAGALTSNHQPLGVLLRNFFRYYADGGMQDSGVQGFSWTQKVLSLRTQGGILTKEEKGWTGAKVTIQDNVEVRHRYLFAIEDPFETTHNVARPVTHNGIVAIRDEFRRAWRILCQVGNRATPEGELLEHLVSQQPAAHEEPADEEKLALAQAA